MCSTQQQIRIPERLKPYHFTFEAWRAGSLIELGIQSREWSISENRGIIRTYAIGYLEADNLWVRPKQNCVAVMFDYNELIFWTHFTRKEFKMCFPNILLKNEVKNEMHLYTKA